jgi:hypothetical protein
MSWTGRNCNAGFRTTSLPFFIGAEPAAFGSLHCPSVRRTGSPRLARRGRPRVHFPLTVISIASRYSSEGRSASCIRTWATTLAGASARSQSRRARTALARGRARGSRASGWTAGGRHGGTKPAAPCPPRRQGLPGRARTDDARGQIAPDHPPVLAGRLVVARTQPRVSFHVSPQPPKDKCSVPGPSATTGMARRRPSRTCAARTAFEKFPHQERGRQ